MHEHVVLVKLADKADIEAVVERMRTMTGRIVGMVDLHAAVDELEGANSYDVMLRTRFVDRAAYDSYAVDPIHTEVAAFVRSKMTAAATFDHETGD